MRLLIILLLACWPLAAVDLVYIAGCETGAIAAEWDIFASATCSTTRVKNGTYAVEQLTSDLQTVDLGAITEIWLRFDVQIDVLPTITATALKLRDGASASFLVMDVDTDGSVGIEGTTSTFDMVVDTWYLFEVHYKKGTGSNGEYHLWVDGTEEIAVTNSALTDDVHFINPEAFGDGGTFMDNFAASTVGRIGDGQSVALRPNADASPDLFETFAAGSSTFPEVDDDPVVDSTGARAPTSGGPPVNQEWDLTTEASVGAINAVQILARASQGGGGGGSETIRPNSTTNDVVGYSACVTATISDDPDLGGGTFCNGLGTDVDTEVDAVMEDPTAAISTGTNEQEVRACFNSTGESSDPTCSIDILEGNVVRVNDVFSGAITQTSGCSTVSAGTWTWVPGDWTDTTGDAIEVGIDCAPGTGNPANRASGSVGAVELNLTTAASTTHELIANNDNDTQSSKSGDLSLTGTLAWYTFKPTGLVVPTSQADLDAYEIGAEQSIAGAPLMDVSDIFLIVDHDGVPPAGGGKRRAMVSLIGTLNLLGLQ